METINVKRSVALNAYNSADNAGRELLEIVFGDNLKPMIERVNSFKDACRVCPPSSVMQALFDYEGDDAEMIFTSNKAKRDYLAKVIKDGWEANALDTTQKRWYVWFRKTSSGWVFSGTHYGYTSAGTDSGSRLEFPTAEAAKHWATIEPELHNAVLDFN